MWGARTEGLHVEVDDLDLPGQSAGKGGVFVKKRRRNTGKSQCVAPVLIEERVDGRGGAQQGRARRAAVGAARGQLQRRKERHRLRGRKAVETRAKGGAARKGTVLKKKGSGNASERRCRKERHRFREERQWKRERKAVPY